MSAYRSTARIVAHVPELLRETRRRRGMSLRAVADATGLTTPTIDNIEKGRGYHVYSLIAILRWLHEQEGGAPDGP